MYLWHEVPLVGDGAYAAWPEYLYSDIFREKSCSYEPWINMWHFIMSLKCLDMIYNLSVLWVINHTMLTFWICYHTCSAGSRTHFRIKMKGRVSVPHMMLSKHMIEHICPVRNIHMVLWWYCCGTAVPAVPSQRRQLMLSVIHRETVCCA